METAVTKPDRDAEATINKAGRIGDGTPRTEHLLVAMGGAGTELLTAVEVTPTVAVFVARAFLNRTSNVEDDATVARTLRRAADRAAAAGKTEYGTDDVMFALLDESRSHAVELLASCGVDIAALRAGAIPPVAERVPPELRETRDRLLGRLPFRGLGLWAKLFTAIVPVRLNHAAAPVLWARHEAVAQAAHLGHRRCGTDHLLLALLATYEVAQAYPHLTVGSEQLYDANPLFAQAGLRYADARAAAQTFDAGTDPRPLDAYVVKDGQPQHTATVVRAITGDRRTRAVRLLSALGLDAELGSSRRSS